jgi:hypothetical protein
MKRIYLLVALMIGMATSAMAQSTDLRLLSSLRATDTVRWNASGTYGKIIVWGFANLGPTALTSTDTIKFKTPYMSLNLLLPSAGLPVNDTVYFIDTVFFNAAPATNPYNWCDSAYVKRGSAAMSDPNIGNNRNCVSMRFIETATSVNAVAANEAGLAIFPNPATQIVNIKYNFASETANVTLRDLMGKVVYTKELGKNLYGEKQFPLDISALTPGLYMIELNDGKNRVVSKITVE